MISKIVQIILFFMKKIILLHFLLLFYLNTWCQIVSFPSDSTTWYYYSEDNSGPNPVFNYYQYDITGDTSFNNNSYKIVTGNGLSYAVRSDSAQKVWVRSLNTGYCNDTSEILSYDFSLALNDSIYVKGCNGDSFLCIVRVIDSISTNIGKRREIKLTGAETLTCLMSDTITWVEGIGSTYELFYNFINFFFGGPGTCPYYFYFLSLDSHGQNIYFTTSLPELQIQNLIFVDDKFIVHSKDKIKLIVVHDVIGRLIDTYIPNFQICQLNSSRLTKGLNYISVITERNIFSLKVLN